MKSPSCDSESSDQNQSSIPGSHGVVPPRVARLTTRMDKRALFRQYRTDSETTDDQITIPVDSNDEGICLDTMKCKKLVVRNVSSVLKEDVKSFTLPEIVVEHCTNIPEQDSTESVSSVRSSVHNSLDDCQDPACHFSPSGSSSRSESPTLSDKNSVISASLQVIDSDLNASESLPCSSIQMTKKTGASSARKEKKVFRKKVSRSNSPTYASDQGKESYPPQTSPKKSKLNKRRFRSQNKFEFRTSSSTESLGSTSSLRLLSQSRLSSNSSSDESQEENCQEPVTSPPVKTSSSSTSTSKASSPLGSLTLLSLPSKPKSSSRPRQQRKKQTPPLMRTPPLSTNSSDSFASNQETSMESFLSVDAEEKFKMEQTELT